MSFGRGRSPCDTSTLELRPESGCTCHVGRCPSATERRRWTPSLMVRSRHVAAVVMTRTPGWSAATWTSPRGRACTATTDTKRGSGMPATYLGSPTMGTPSRGVPHEPAAAASSDSNSLRCHRSTRASMSTMSHQLAASRGLPQTAPGLAMQAPVPSQS